MKIKVDKYEYQALLETVKRLEEKIREEDFTLYENWKWTRETLYDLMESYFKTRCITTIVKRDRDMIVGCVKANAIENIFKEEDESR